VRVPPGDAAVLTSAVVKDGSLAVGIGWPSTGSGDEKLFMVAGFGTTADSLDNFVSQMEGLFTGGFSSLSWTDSTGKGVFTSFAEVVPSERPEAQTIAIPSDIQGTGPVTVRLYAKRGEKLLPASNAVQFEYSAGGRD
jgi:hypothetical protein